MPKIHFSIQHIPDDSHFYTSLMNSKQPYVIYSTPATTKKAYIQSMLDPVALLCEEWYAYHLSLCMVWPSLLLSLKSAFGGNSQIIFRKKVKAFLQQRYNMQARFQLRC